MTEANCQNHGEDFSEVLESKRAQAKARREARKARRMVRRAARRKRAAERTEWLEQKIAQARKLAEEAVVVGYGATLIAKDKLQDLAEEAHELGAEKRDEADPMTRFFLQLFSNPPDEKERETAQVKVPVLPIENYNELTVEEVTARLDNLTADQLKMVRDYETAHKNRKGVVEEIDRRTAE